MDAPTDLQKAELRKAFTICDVEGKGVISAKDLKFVTKEILGYELTPEEFSQVLNSVDKNRDGKIEWEEFLEVMTEWLGEDLKPEAVKRRKLTPEQERAEIHRKVKGFFTQFTKADNFGEIRNKLQRYGSFVGNAFVNMENPTQMFLNDDQVMTSQQKLDFLFKFRENRVLLPKAVQAIFTDHNEERLKGCALISELLKIVEIFSTPMERRAIAEDIVPLFEFLVKAQLPSRLIKLIAYDQPDLQLHVLKALTYFAPGPRIGSTPESSILHPNKMFFKNMLLVEDEFLRNLFRILHEKKNQRVVEQVVVLLGTIASHNPACRDLLIHSGALLALLDLVRNDAPISLLKDVSWTLSVFCGVTHPPSAFPKWSSIQAALEPLATMLFCNDTDVVRNVLLSLSLILPGIGPDLKVTRRFIELLGVNSPEVQKMTLNTLTDLVRLDVQHTTILIQCGLMGVIQKLLSAPDKDVRIATTDLIYYLASARGQTQQLIDNGIIRDMLVLVGVDENVRWKLVKVLKYVSCCTPSQVRYLVEHNAINQVCKTLNDFKSYDRVLTEVYKFVGATYNFELLSDVLSTLTNILNVGETEAEDGNGINPYALRFDIEVLDKIGSILKLISESKPEDVNSWRLHGSEAIEKPELKIKALLLRIRTALVKSGEGVKIKMIDDILNAYQATQPVEEPKPEVTVSTTTTTTTTSVTAADPPAGAPEKDEKEKAVEAKEDKSETREKIILKCYDPDGDIRVIDINSDIKFQTLQRGMDRKYGRRLKIGYKDEEGDLITLDSDTALAACIRQWRASGQSTLKLHLQEVGSKSIPITPVGSSTPVGSPFASPIGSPSKGLEDIAFFNMEKELEDLKEALATNAVANEQNKLASSAGVKRSREGKEVTNSTSEEKLSGLGLPVLQPIGEQFSLQGDLEEIKREQRKQLFLELERQTHFGMKELEDLFNWVKSESASGKVDRPAFNKALVAIGIKDKLTIEQYFSAFDTDKDGTIDFREFACGLSIVLKGTPEERLQLMFNAYDLDGNGNLDQLEFFNMCATSMRNNGAIIVDSQLKKTVVEMFHELDEDKDGKITFSEFHKAVHSNKFQLLTKLLQ